MPQGLTVYASHRSLVVTFSLNHAHQIRASVEGEGWSHLVAECGYRGLESREGTLKYHPSQGSFWFRQCPARDDQGMFPLLL